MEFVVGTALVAGLVATLVMTAMMKMARASEMTEMPSFEIMMGSW